MATVVVEPKPPVEGAMGGIKGIIEFFAHNWPWFLVIIIVVILAVVIIMLINKLEDERKERDEPGYQLYKNIKMACDLNKEPQKIRKTFNAMTLPLIFVPIFGWILMALIKKEHSARVVDYQNNLLGHYRGDYVSQDNTWNFLVYKSKWLIFFEKTFVIKAPLGFDLTKVVKDKDGKVEYEDDKRTPRTTVKHLDLRNFIAILPNGDYKIQCTGIEPIGIYYKCPVYIIPQTGEHVDYRKFIEGSIVDGTYQLMVTRLLNLGAKQMEKSMMFSPDLQYRKQAPIKTKEEEATDQYEGRA
jgi:hypothetical protein